MNDFAGGGGMSRQGQHRGGGALGRRLRGGARGKAGGAERNEESD
jgi:hypothetical protein